MTTCEPLFTLRPRNSSERVASRTNIGTGGYNLKVSRNTFRVSCIDANFENSGLATNPNDSFETRSPHSGEAANSQSAQPKSAALVSCPARKNIAT